MKVITVSNTGEENTLLDVKDLNVEFRLKNGTVKAVDNISFKIKKGEFLAIVGESGCGKSVTVLSLMRLLPPVLQIFPLNILNLTMWIYLGFLKVI